MAALDFPKNPVLNQTYDFPPFQYIWDGVKWKTVGRGADTVAEAIDAHKSAVDQHPISGVAGLRAELDNLIKNSGKPVLSTDWVSKRAAMWTGYTGGDGQLLSRSLYPDAWAAIQAGMVPLCTDAEWLADPAKRGCYTTGDGSTTFRLPDYNGVYSGSYGPVYLGGGTTDGGTILRDRIQDHQHMQAGSQTPADGESSNSVGQVLIGSTWAAQARGLTFGVRGAGVRTGDTTRPITAEGCIAIKLFGAVQNTGSADAAALATAVAALAARVTALEARKSTTLIPATYPSGAPHDTHETVDAALPANLAVNSRYVLTNPFGSNVRVQCHVEIWYNGEWVNPGWDGNTGAATPLSYGVTAYYVQGAGIRVTTGNSGIGSTDARLTGGANTISGSSAITSAPCRVAVRKWEA